MQTDFIVGSLQLNSVSIPVISDFLNFGDILGAIKARWAINRNNYKINPGLYAIGKPNENSNIFVTANYKLSFDHLRKNLKSIDSWILILDTKGINVWCAAGKGTFGTEELIKQIQQTKLVEIVNHKKIILPQLGAVGVSAHDVKKITGFHVIYGPVKASDIPDFINNKFTASREMRTVFFPFFERIKLIPVEIIGHFQYLIFAIAVFFILAGINSNGYSVDKAFDGGLKAMVMLLAGFLSGVAIAPALLPYIPVKQFFMKGAILAYIITGLLIYFFPGISLFENISWFFIVPAVSAFIAMNFTGTSTYTSLSGVLKEMKLAIPLQIIFAFIGLVLWIIGRFI